ncbi:MAG: short-chain dehydrogenase/reductase SDR [Spirochaetes bacterium]|nr:MAG: short-chain dehydrogenase/reductase SDR [Spirochaetota bacterium]
MVSDRLCLVSGATSGIGLALACALAARGARVVGLGRAPDKAARAFQAVKAAAPESDVRYDILDLSSLKAVADYARSFLDRESRPLDVLVNCAGLYSDRRQLSVDGYEMQFAINHLAAFALTEGLAESLESSSDGRVVAVSSDSHYYGWMRWKKIEAALRGEKPRTPYFGLGAYEESKLANVLFVRALATRHAFTSFAADPGLVNTEMGLKQGASLGSLVWGVRRRFGTIPEVPAKAIADLVSDPALKGRSGGYWKEGREVPPSRRALDDDAARRLWALSQALVDRALAESALSEPFRN